MRKLTPAMITALVAIAQASVYHADTMDADRDMHVSTRKGLIERGLIDQVALRAPLNHITIPVITDAGAEWLHTNRYVAWADEELSVIAHVSTSPMSELEQTAWVDLVTGRAPLRALALREINRIAGHQDWSAEGIERAHVEALRLNAYQAAQPVREMFPAGTRITARGGEVLIVKEVTAVGMIMAYAPGGYGAFNILRPEDVRITPVPVPSPVQAAPAKVSPTKPVFRAEWELILNAFNEGRELRDEPFDLQIFFAVADGGDVVVYDVFRDQTVLSLETGLTLTLPEDGLTQADRDLIADVVEAANHGAGCCAPLTTITTYAQLGIAEAPSLDDIA